MKYPLVSTTIDGDNLESQTTANNDDYLVIDKAIFSNNRNTSGDPIEQTKLSDFYNDNDSSVKPFTTPITTVKHNDNTTQPEVTLNNKDFQSNYPVYMIGILAHANSDPSGNETLYAVAEATDNPLIMPKATDNSYICDFGVPIAFSPNSNVTIKTTESGMVDQKEFDNFSSEADSLFINYGDSINDNSESIGALSSVASYNTSQISDTNNLAAVVDNAIFGGDTGSNSVSANTSSISSIADDMATQSDINHLTSWASSNTSNTDKVSTFVNTLNEEYLSEVDQEAKDTNSLGNQEYSDYVSVTTSLEDYSDSSMYIPYSISANTSNIASLSNDLNNLSANTSALSNGVDSYHSNNKLSNSVNANASNINTLSTSQKNDESTLNADHQSISSMSTQLSQSSADLSSITNNISSNASNITINSSGITSLRAKLDSAEDTIATIGDNATGNKIDVSSLKSQISSISSSIDKLSHSTGNNDFAKWIPTITELDNTTFDFNNLPDGIHVYFYGDNVSYQNIPQEGHYNMYRTLEQPFEIKQVTNEKHGVQSLLLLSGQFFAVRYKNNGKWFGWTILEIENNEM